MLYKILFVIKMSKYWLLYILWGSLLSSFRRYLLKCVFYNKDIDECEQGTSDCEQICQNTDGRYKCYCNDGFKLMKNACTGIYIVVVFRLRQCVYKPFTLAVGKFHSTFVWTINYLWLLIFYIWSKNMKYWIYTCSYMP